MNYHRKPYFKPRQTILCRFRAGALPHAVSSVNPVLSPPAWPPLCLSQTCTTGCKWELDPSLRGCVVVLTPAMQPPVRTLDSVAGVVYGCAGHPRRCGCYRPVPDDWLRGYCVARWLFPARAVPEKPGSLEWGRGRSTADHPLMMGASSVRVCESGRRGERGPQESLRQERVGDRRAWPAGHGQRPIRVAAVVRKLVRPGRATPRAQTPPTRPRRTLVSRPAVHRMRRYKYVHTRHRSTVCGAVGW